MSKRPPLPEKVKQRVLYDSAFSCAVCQRRASHIHHIDKDPTNNSPDNLVAVCSEHHDDAHTHRELSQNLTADRMRKLRDSWYADVLRRRARAVDIEWQRGKLGWLAMGVQWGYINHRRVSQMVTADLLRSVDQQNLKRCVALGIVDRNATIIKPSGLTMSHGYVGNTIYDWFEFGQDHMLHRLYSQLVDAAARRMQPIILEDASWTKKFFRSMVKPGTAIFVTKASYFKKVSETADNAHVKVKTFKKGIEVEYFIDTRDMFGTTSITVSFSGHKTCSALLLVKSVSDGDEGKITAHCTSIALGIGFIDRPIAEIEYADDKPLDRVADANVQH